MTNKEFSEAVEKIQLLEIKANQALTEIEEIKKQMTPEERNKLFDILMADGKSHFV
jgi:hypothetical protein